ncbi:MAG: hypothetical protein IIX97_04860 [Clostridia bacterium]|nr:hypothetical protein [Clostridia bacterium]
MGVTLGDYVVTLCRTALAPIKNEGGYFIAKPPKKCYDCLFRVRIIPAKAPIKAIGAVLTNNHSNA